MNALLWMAELKQTQGQKNGRAAARVEHTKCPPTPPFFFSQLIKLQL